MLVIGCGGDAAPGVLVEVHSDAAVKRFELLYSLEPCSDCDHMAPPSRPQAPIQAAGWLTADTERFAIELADSRNVARFQLQTVGPEDLYVKRAVVVALAGDAPAEREVVVGVQTLDSFMIPATESVKFELELHPADGAFDTDTGKAHVEMWRRAETPMTHPACLLVQDAGTAEFFAWKDDPDCDDPKLTGAECTEFGYLSYKPPSLAQASCRAHDAANHCRIGGPPCVEAPQPGIDPACMAVEPSYCLPAHVCTLTCPNLFAQNCIGLQVSNTPAVQCDIYTGAGSPCPLSRTRLAVQELVADTSVRKCKSIEIAPILLPLTFGNRVVIGDAGSLATFTIDPATFDEATCSIDLTWSGTFAASAVGLIKVVTETGVNRVVPMRFVLKDTQCPGSPPVTCIASSGLPTDTLYTCE